MYKTITIGERKGIYNAKTGYIKYSTEKDLKPFYVISHYSRNNEQFIVMNTERNNRFIEGEIKDFILSKADIIYEEESYECLLEYFDIMEFISSGFEGIKVKSVKCKNEGEKQNLAYYQIDTTEQKKLKKALIKYDFDLKQKKKVEIEIKDIKINGFRLFDNLSNKDFIDCPFFKGYKCKRTPKGRLLITKEELNYNINLSFEEFLGLYSLDWFKFIELNKNISLVHKEDKKYKESKAYNNIKRISEYKKDLKYFKKRYPGAYKLLGDKGLTIIKAMLEIGYRDIIQEDKIEYKTYYMMSVSTRYLVKYLKDNYDLEMSHVLIDKYINLICILDIFQKVEKMDSRITIKNKIGCYIISDKQDINKRSEILIKNKITIKNIDYKHIESILNFEDCKRIFKASNTLYEELEKRKEAKAAFEKLFDIDLYEEEFIIEE